MHNDGGATSTLHWTRKADEHVDGIDTPDAFVVQETDVSAEPMPGTDGAWSSSASSTRSTPATTCTSTS